MSWALFVYDADGNVTSRTNTSTNQLMQFYWDAGSQMDSVLVSGGGQASYRVDYRYDAYGRLIWRAATGSFPSTQRLYLYGAGSGGSNIGKEIDLVTGHTTEYEYAGVDHPTMSVTRDSTGTVLVSRTFMLDGLGNVVGSALDGSSGAAIIYDSWGNVQTDSTAMMRLNTLRFGFKGMLYDETTGLYNARARWYQPDVGRFMSEDPIGLSGGINQYAFAGDDPINNSDPSGALVTDAQGSVCSINASSCGDPLQFPGSSSYTSSAYGGGVSFAGGFGSTTPGAGAVGASGRAGTGAPGLGGGGIRTLTPQERITFGDWCAVAICDNVVIVNGPFSRSVTFGYIILLGTEDWFGQIVIAHELTHTAQYEIWGAFDYYAAALHDRISELQGGHPYDYTLNGRSYGNYGMEQQAQITQDCFSRFRPAACSITPYHKTP